MKKKVFFTVIVLVGLFAFNASAQVKLPTTTKVPTDKSQINLPSEDASTEILKALNPGKDFTTADKLTKLLGNNKSYVEDITKLMNGGGSENEKMTKINLKKNEREDFIENLLGESKAATYYSRVKEKIEPLVEKYKMAKMFL